jgi:hypothetical protein
MREVLLTGRAIRPYMKTRMPQFGQQNIGHLIPLFQVNDPRETVEVPVGESRESVRKRGLQIVGNQGLNCVACHTYQYKLSDTMPAVDLTEMAERLNKDWFHRYMLAPQKFVPNTLMPSFWPGGKAIRTDLEGDAASQVEAIWQYLLDGRQANAPPGVVREPLEIVVHEEARLLRRSYQGIGKRGIGVGYPGNVNLAFDAEQLRLAMIWKGKFVDPAGVWYGQGHGHVRTLGRPIPFAPGPDLDDATLPWSIDDGRPPQHRFLGYQLDAKRRPTFCYQFDGACVQDFFTEYADGPQAATQLRRMVKISSAKPYSHLRFRVAKGAIEALSEQTFRTESGVEIRIHSNSKAVLVGERRDGSLQIPIAMEAEQSIEFTIDYVWE